MEHDSARPLCKYDLWLIFEIEVITSSFLDLDQVKTENRFVFVSETFHPMTALSQYLKCNFNIRAKQVSHHTCLHFTC